MGKNINVFLAGYGKVGGALVKLVAEQGESIRRRSGKNLRLLGISNSTKFSIDLEGLPLDDCRQLLAAGESALDSAYFERLKDIQVENAVFVDCTASADVQNHYLELIEKGYSIVTCNKHIFADKYERYSELKAAALEHGVSLRYETTAGAALPVLDSIERCVNSGDGIRSIRAVLSGTLGYVLSTYKGCDGCTFADVIRDAKALGLTEPDPRIDLSGRDVLRKLLIIGRESGLCLEEADVDHNPLLESKYFESDLDGFYSLLEADEPEFQKLYKAAKDKNQRLRYVASLEIAETGCSARVGLEAVGADDPLYTLQGPDNSIIITSDFYPSPLVVQGAGAGAPQTASGVLADILRN